MKTTIRTAALAGALSFLIAVAVDLLLLAIANAISGPIDVAIPGREQPVGVVAVIVVVLLASIAGAVGTAILARWSWGLRVVVIVGALVTLASLVGVASATTPTGVIALALMHLVTGSTIVIVNVVLQSRRVRAVRSTR